MTTTTDFPVEFSSSEEVSDRDHEHAVEAVTKALTHIDEPVQHVRIRLDLAEDPARERPAAASAVVRMRRGTVRAQVAAEAMPAAIDALHQRLRTRLERMAEHRRALRKRSQVSGDWHHGDAPTQRPGHFPRPVEDREVVRHKTFTTTHANLDEAIYDLESMDYDFFLFTDETTGAEAFVHRREDGTYGLQHLDGPPEEASAVAEVVVEHDAVPTLDERTARAHLDNVPESWVFYRDADRGRGHVLYRRYDGHYGLLTPRDDA